MRTIKRINITSGALVLVIISFLFTAAVYKIDNSNLDKQKQITHSVCMVVAGANKNVGATRVRIQSAINRDIDQAKAEDRIASVWKFAAKSSKGNVQGERLAHKLIFATKTLAREDRASVADLQRQLKGVAPIDLSGC